jgi:signal transduction histidine kinase
VYVVCAVAFIADMTRTNTLAYGIFYVPLITTAVFHRRRGGLWILTAVACVLVVVGALFPVVDFDLPDLIGNRILSILSILATAAFVHHARTTQERLAEARRRAEAAERIKTEVFTNLSQEMRTPLHALLGLLNLMMATCRPDQAEALGRVRGGGKQLLDSIDNLIDLTGIEERRLQRQTLDLAAFVRDAADSARDAAEERKVAIRVAPAEGSLHAVGDAWAVRRILDNLIANAVRFAPPGSIVSMMVKRDASRVMASVSDAGPGLPAGVADYFAAGEDGALMPASGGTGLTLSERLAHAMGGRLTVSPGAGFGATVNLSLPAA